MGLFEDLGVDMDEIAEGGSYVRPDDGWYSFTITKSEIRKGTKSDPNILKFMIEYDLDEAGKASEWWTVAESGEVTDKARKSLGFLKTRLLSLGVDPATFDPQESDLREITGSLHLKTKNDYQNVVEVVTEAVEDADEDDDDDEPVEEPVESDAAIKARVQANQKARAAQAAKKPAAKKPAAKKAPASKAADNPFEGLQ